MMHEMMGWGWLGAIVGLLIFFLIAAVLTAGLILSPAGTPAPAAQSSRPSRRFRRQSAADP